MITLILSNEDFGLLVRRENARYILDTWRFSKYYSVSSEFDYGPTKLARIVQ